MTDLRDILIQTRGSQPFHDCLPHHASRMRKVVDVVPPYKDEVTF